MEAGDDEIVRLVEPVFRFCLRRLGNRADAEDLASEIITYALDGLSRYDIRSLDHWVWRVAHNRCARFLRLKADLKEIPIDEIVRGSAKDDCREPADDYCAVDTMIVEEEHQRVFLCLHSLCAAYRNLIVDHYLGGLSVSRLAVKYSISEPAVKWRLNVGREKIRDRLGGNEMERIYRRIDWNTTCCNGAMDANRYLFSQTARAICEACFEKPLTVEEIGMKTGLPTVYVEDELPRLIAGDAIAGDTGRGGRYATDFIILRLRDRKAMEARLAPAVASLADEFERLFSQKSGEARRIGFYGADRGMEKLGHIALPAVLRQKIRAVKDAAGLADGPFPPRKDGGYGWFIVEETETDEEKPGPLSSGCCITDDKEDAIYYFTVGAYLDGDIYHNGGTRWMAAKRLVACSLDGVIPEGLLSEDDKIRLLGRNLIVRRGGGFALNFPVFTPREFSAFTALFDLTGSQVDEPLTALTKDIRTCFDSFVPKRLENQINQWVSCYLSEIIGGVTKALIGRGSLTAPTGGLPLTDGVFCIKGETVEV